MEREEDSGEASEETSVTENPWPRIGQRVRLPGDVPGMVTGHCASGRIAVRTADRMRYVTRHTLMDGAFRRKTKNRRIARLARMNGVSYAVACEAARMRLKRR